MAMVLHVISGYLGAGKTTLVNRLIDAPDAGRLCVIVNDFGALSVDANLLARSDGLVLPLANGCICCSATAGLYTAFNTVLTLDPAPTQVIVEASGVADPARIAAVARAEPDFAPGGIVTLVDPDSLSTLLADPLIAPDVVRQITAADAVLLSRTDILEARVIDMARDLVEDISPLAHIESANELNTHHDLGDLLRSAPMRQRPAPRMTHDSRRYAHVIAHGNRLVDTRRLATRLVAFGEPSLRLKGIVRTDSNESLQRIDFTNGTLTIEPIDLAQPLSRGFITAVFLDRQDLKHKLEALAADHLIFDDSYT